ncbi:MAG: hypothetical protein ACXVPQ_02795 [Bacteroidia bacterium]
MRTDCRKKFLYYFKKGFADPKYHDWERGYKWDAHVKWKEQLNEPEFLRLLENGDHEEIAARAVRIESRTNLLFSFEKMALRDGIRSGEGARLFAEGLYDYIYGTDELPLRFERLTGRLEKLPRKQTRVLTWPLHTVFGFIGDPKQHIFLKPKVTRIAAEKYDYDLDYLSRPNWSTYESLLSFAALVKKELRDLKPKDMIDVQSFIWVLGSDEYPD